MRRGSRRWIRRGGLGLSLLLVSASAAGGVSVTVVAQSGVGDGHPAVEVPVGRPIALAADAAGTLYISQGHRVRRVDPAGIIDTVIVQPPAANPTSGSSVTHSRVAAIAIGNDGTVFFADDAQHRVRALSPDGSVVTVAGNGRQGYSGDGGPGSEATLSGPRGIAVDGAGNVYIADGHRIRKVDPGGTITTIAGTGESGREGDGGPAVAAHFQEPADVAVDEAGNVFLIDGFPWRTVRRIDAGGTIISLPLGEHVTDIATGPDGLYFARRGQVWRYTPDGQVELVAGVGGYQDFTGDNGPATEAKFGWIGAIAVAPGGVLYIADHSNKRIRRVDAEGVVTTVAGNGTWGMFGDGGPANGSSFTCTDLAIAPDGRLFVSDTPNHRVAVIDAKGIINTYAGTGKNGFEGDGGPARVAALYRPTGIALGADGSLYIADTSNHRVRKVDPDGTITAVAGTGSDTFGGDGGPATTASIDRPRPLALGGDGTLYVADLGNRRIRRIDPAGVITTVAGNGGGDDAPDGVPAASASIGYPDGIALRPDGALLIAISAAHRVKEVRSDGTLWTVAGTGAEGFAGDGGAATAGLLATPRGVATAPDGSVWIADTGNARIRRVQGGVIETVPSGDAAMDAGAEISARLTALIAPRTVRLTPDGTTAYVCDTAGERIIRIELDGESGGAP